MQNTRIRTVHMVCYYLVFFGVVYITYYNAHTGKVYRVNLNAALLCNSTVCKGRDCTKCNIHTCTVYYKIIHSMHNVREIIHELLLFVVCTRV